MLVAALAGDPAWRRMYDHAVAERMRFYSYGDCSLILPGIEEALR
jgi:S-adenosylmethionine:tRNA ribosyltransferase-isomerase